MIIPGARLLRRLRSTAQRWSPADDRLFHDRLFADQRYDPFTFAYPGYLTIRRFADHAAARFEGVRRAVDLGCGPGEITCELARRFPTVTFTGIDHSATAIERARAHVQRLGIANATFEAADVERFTPDAPVDLVMMFDSFHHLIDPMRFVRHATTYTGRFLLIEPAGSWTGSWQRELDLDWLPLAIDTLRARAAWQLGSAVTTVEPSPGPPHGGEEGRAVEQRYPVEDFLRFFEGFGLDVRGTVAGLEVYPPAAYQPRALAETFGRVAYEALAGVEEQLFTAGLDLHAKHWVVHAERGRAHQLRTPRPLPRPAGDPPRVQGGYDVEYGVCEAPSRVTAGATFAARVRVTNRSWRPWSSDGDTPVLVSYHWLDARGGTIVFDGVRSPLPERLDPGESCDVDVQVTAPDRPGSHVLAFDLVHEHVTWFSGAGSPVREVAVAIVR